MQNLIGVLIIVLVGVVAFVYFKKRKIDEINDNRHDNKEEIKREILEVLEEKGEVVSHDLAIKYGLNISTIRRYFDELEEEGLVVQKGENKGAVYRRF